eukprot:423079-Karenia_brevis.AAC.1
MSDVDEVTVPEASAFAPLEAETAGRPANQFATEITEVWITRIATMFEGVKPWLLIAADSLPKFFLSLFMLTVLATLAKPKWLVHLAVSVCKFVPNYISYAVRRMFDQVLVELTPESLPTMISLNTTAGQQFSTGLMCLASLFGACHYTNQR